MHPKLSNELERAVTANADGTLKVEGDNGVYWLLTEDAMRVRTDVQQGLEEADRGKIEPWNADEIKREGRRLRQARSQDD
jgi:hypothetical protein